MNPKLVLCLLLCFMGANALDKVCYNQNKKEVDWYVIFLYPTSSSGGKLMYGYFDSTRPELTFYEYKDDTFPPNLVTAQAITGKTDYNFFFWNDDKTCKDDPETKSASSSKAHAKGELIFDAESGTFLLHSLPRYPTRMLDGTTLLEMPSNAGQYGQHFLCISVPINSVYKITELLNYVNISNNLSVKEDRVNKESPNHWINKLIKNKMDSKYPPKVETTIKSLKGTPFTFFSKGLKHNEVPWDNELRQKYDDTFYVRTWTRPASSPMICEENQLLNVLDVTYDKYSFGKDKEHSKWAVSKTKHICCFGDLNHTDSQRKRGGHIVCFQNKTLADIMRKVIINSDQCPPKQIKNNKNLV